MSAVEFNNVWEKYRIKFINEGKVSWEEVWVLNDISFKVEKGEVLGIIGKNGAGKTTILKLIAGMLIPDKGSLSVDGKVSALMELGAGFNPEFTGRENIMLNSRMYGLDEDVIQQQIQNVIDFAGIGKFINAPVKYYSQGMYMRLAFALAIFVEPDVLLIDEVLAVGDELARNRCIKKILELKQANKTIIVVSHDMNMLRKLCDRVILIESGKIAEIGMPQEIISRYENKLEYHADEEECILSPGPEVEKMIKNQHTIRLGDISLFTDIRNNTIRIYYKNNEITQPRHGINFKDAVYSEVQKVSENELIVISRHMLPHPFSQIFTFVCQEEDVIDIKIETEFNEQTSLLSTGKGMMLGLRDLYGCWITNSEKGDFLVNQYIDNRAPVRLKNNKISKFILKPKSDKPDIPILSFETTYQPDKQILGVCKVKNGGEEYIDINFSRIIQKGERLNKAGRFISFSGRIIFNKEIELKEDIPLFNINRINKADIKVDFDQGKGAIFCGERELTSGLGIYTSVLFSGIWYDSCQAAWQVIEKDNHKIVALGDWPHMVPISQTWQIELINDNLISWKVDMEVYEEVNLGITQANIMLSSEFKDWVIPNLSRGEFIDEYPDDYDVSPFRLWYGKANEIVSVAKGLPKIIFKSELKDKGLRAIVENAESLYRARRIQFQSTKIDRIAPGAYRYFEGKIEIDNK